MLVHYERSSNYNRLGWPTGPLNCQLHKSINSCLTVVFAFFQVSALSLCLSSSELVIFALWLFVSTGTLAPGISWKVCKSWETNSDQQNGLTFWLRCVLCPSQSRDILKLWVSRLGGTSLLLVSSRCPAVPRFGPWYFLQKKPDRLDFSFDIISPIHCLARGRRLLAVYLFCFYLALLDPPLELKCLLNNILL